MSYSLKQASHATGLAKSTIQRAIKGGKISAAITESGAYQIDPVELHRIFPPVAEQQNATLETANESTGLRVQVELLRDMVDYLKGKLEAEAEERRRTQAQLTALLTDQRERTPEQTTQTATRLRFWLFR